MTDEIRVFDPRQMGYAPEAIRKNENQATGDAELWLELRVVGGTTTAEEAGKLKGMFFFLPNKQELFVFESVLAPQGQVAAFRVKLRHAEPEEAERYWNHVRSQREDEAERGEGQINRQEELQHALQQLYGLGSLLIRSAEMMQELVSENEELAAQLARLQQEH